MKTAKISSSCCISFSEVDMLDEPRVLIVGDDAETRRLLRSILTSYEMHVTQCENATEALLAVMGGSFDYILVYQRMQEMDGVELIQRLRTRLPPLTVIIGMSDGEKEREFLDAGANDFVSKPFVPYDVAMMIDGRDLLL